MVVRFQVAAFRFLAIAGFVGIIGVLAFVHTVPNASEMALRDGCFAVLGNFLASTGIVVLGLTGLAWAFLSFVLVPLVKCVLGLSQTGAQILDWIEWVFARMAPPVHVPGRTGPPQDGTWHPLDGEFMQPGTGLRDNVCIFAQMWAVPISVVLVILGLSFFNWVF